MGVKQDSPPPATNEIQMNMHCKVCLASLPSGESPASWARLTVGFTRWGIQVWCERHDINVMHVDFEGKSPFPTNLNAVARDSDG